MSIIKKAIKKEPKLNLIWSCYNPLKMWVLIIDLAKIMNRVIDSPEELNSLENEIVEIMLSIISDVEIPGILRYWLYDEIGDGVKVIDLFARLDLLLILNHPKIVRTVEHIWRGTYDWNNDGVLVSATKRGAVAVNFWKLDISDDAYMTMIGSNKNGAMIKYTFKLAIEVIKNSFKFETSNHILFKSAEKIKLPAYGYVAYTNSIYLKVYIDLILLILFSIAVWIALIYETHSRAQMETTYATITDLLTQTQTTSVLSSIETKYANLQIQGETWHYWFIWMIILNTYFCSCYIQDGLIYVTLLIKETNLMLISPSFMLMLIVNSIHLVFAILFIHNYNSEYDIVVIKVKL